MLEAPTGGVMTFQVYTGTMQALSTPDQYDWTVTP